MEVNNKLYLIVKDIINSKTNKLRYEGKQYYSDRTITSAEKQGLKNVLDAYEGLLVRINAYIFHNLLIFNCST